MTYFLILLAGFAVIVWLRYLLIVRFYENVVRQFTGFFYLLHQADGLVQDPATRYKELNPHKEQLFKSLFDSPLLVALDLSRRSYDEWVGNPQLWDEMNGLVPYSQVVQIRDAAENEE